MTDNEKKAKEAAYALFPEEKWTTVENGIFLSSRRAIGEKSNYKNELRCAQILRDEGSIVYLTPESRRFTGKKFDAIVDGLKFEFKNVSGNLGTLEKQFLRSRSQAPNVLINLENSSLSKKDIISTLYGARNRPATSSRHGYTHYNKFLGGLIILKLKDQERLIYIKVDDLKIKENKKTGR